MNIFNPARNAATYKPTNLKQTQKDVGSKPYLLPEDFFKSLLSYYKPIQPHTLPLGSRTPRNPEFLNTLLQKQSSAPISPRLNTLSTEVQIAVKNAIQNGEFGTPIDTRIALIVTRQLSVFSDMATRNTIATAIMQGLASGAADSTSTSIANTMAIAAANGTFGIPLDPSLAIAITQKLGLCDRSLVARVEAPLVRTVSETRHKDPLYGPLIQEMLKNINQLSSTKGVLMDTITHAIEAGQLGNPINFSMATMIVGNLFHFSTGNRERILTAVSQGILGHPVSPELSVSILNMNFLGVRNKNREIAASIVNGIFGAPIDPLSATTLIKMFSSFSDSTKSTIVQEIVSGRFGTPPDPVVANAIVDHMRMQVFTSHDRNSLVTAIANGAFGHPMPPSVASNTLAFFGTMYRVTETEHVANCWIPAIQNGVFGDLMDPRVGLAVAKYAANVALFYKSNAKALFNIVLEASAVFKNNPMPAPIAAAVEEILNSYTTRIAPQKTIVTAMAEGVFGNPIPPSLSAFMLLNLGLFSDTTPQNTMATAIGDGTFGNPIDPTVALLLVGKLHVFSDPAALQRLINAMGQGLFGDPIPTEVVLAVFQKLDFFTDRASQNAIASAITDGVLGKSISQGLSQVLFEHLANLEEEIQKKIVLSVLKTSTSSHTPDVLKNILSKFDLNNEWKSDTLTDISIDSSAFSAAKSTLQSYKNIQILITKQMARFNSNWPAKFLTTAFKPIDAQLGLIAVQRPADIDTVFPGFDALWERMMLLRDQIRALQSTLDESAHITDPNDPALAAIHARMTRVVDQIKQLDIKPEAFGAQDSLNQKIQDLENALNTLKTEMSISLDQQFEPKALLGSSVMTMDEFTIDALCEKTGADLRDCFSENQQVTLQLYETNDRKLLLVYDFLAGKAADFRGWLGPHALLYKHVVENIKIYDVSGESPVPLDIQDTHHADFKDLPVFMCKALSDCCFDITRYRHKDELALIFGDDGILNALKSQYAQDQGNLTLISKMQSLIQASIGREGGGVSLAMDRVQDKVLKDAINQLCTREQMDPFITKVKTFLDRVAGSREEKEATYARLGFLFGQLAKRGVLGYHHGNNNTANNLFYTLSATCFEKWSSSATEDPSRTPLLKDLDEGQCIEQVTNDFLIKHPAVGEIWQQL